MGLTHKDKQQLLQILQIAAPIAERSIVGAIEAPQKEKMAALQEQFLQGQIANQQAIAQQPVQSLIPAEGAGKVLGFDVAPVAGPQGNIDPKLFGQLANLAGSRQQGSLKGREIERKAKKDVTTTEETSKTNLARRKENLMKILSPKTDIYSQLKTPEEKERIAFVQEAAMTELKNILAEEQQVSGTKGGVAPQVSPKTTEKKGGFFDNIKSAASAITGGQGKGDIVNEFASEKGFDASQLTSIGTRYIGLIQGKGPKEVKEIQEQIEKQIGVTPIIMKEILENYVQ